MQKLLLVFLIAGIWGLTSCSKTYSCDCGNGAKLEYRSLSSAQAENLEAPCELNGCNWSKN